MNNLKNLPLAIKYKKIKRYSKSGPNLSQKLFKKIMLKLIKLI